jgi:hypothetical protein
MVRLFGYHAREPGHDLVAPSGTEVDRLSPGRPDSASCSISTLTSRLRVVPGESAAERVRIALDMYEFGEHMQRALLLRDRAGASSVDIESAIQAPSQRR